MKTMFSNEQFSRGSFVSLGGSGGARSGSPRLGQVPGWNPSGSPAFVPPAPSAPVQEAPAASPAPGPIAAPAPVQKSSPSTLGVGIVAAWAAALIWITVKGK
jgi:hypothetical protein